MLPTSVLFAFIISICVEVYSQSANTPNLKLTGSNVCSDSQTVSDWILEVPSRVKSNEKPLNKTAEGGHGLHDLEEERPARRNRIVLMRFRGRGRGRRRTRAMKIAPESNYRLDLVNKFTKNTEVLFVAHFLNLTECGMGTFSPFGESLTTRPESIKRKDDCFWSIESSLLLKGKQHYKYITPKCGCFDFSYYIAYKPGDETVIERPDPTSLDPTKKLTKMYCISEHQGKKFSKKSKHKKKNRFRKKGKKHGRKAENEKKLLSRPRKDIGLSEGNPAPLFYSMYSPYRNQIPYDDVEEIHNEVRKDNIKNSMMHYQSFDSDLGDSKSGNDDEPDVDEVDGDEEEREYDNENDERMSADDSEEDDDSNEDMEEEDQEKDESNGVEEEDQVVVNSEIETNEISDQHQFEENNGLNVGLGEKESEESSEEDVVRKRMNEESNGVNEGEDSEEKENNNESKDENNEIENDEELKEDEVSEETDVKPLDDENNIENENDSNEIEDETNKKEEEENKSCESDESEENSNEEEENKETKTIKELTNLNLENENQLGSKENEEDKDNDDSNENKVGRGMFNRMSEHERRMREENRRRHFKLGLPHRRRIHNQRRRAPTNHSIYPRGNFRASQICCNEGIYRKKLVLHNTLENIVEFTETCEDVPNSLVVGVMKRFFVPDAFCIHRFAQCCHTWSLISPRMRRRHHYRQPPI